jgi:hypothetical protein
MITKKKLTKGLTKGKNFTLHDWGCHLALSDCGSGVLGPVTEPVLPSTAKVMRSIFCHALQGFSQPSTLVPMPLTLERGGRCHWVYHGADRIPKSPTVEIEGIRRLSRDTHFRGAVGSKAAMYCTWVGSVQSKFKATTCGRTDGMIISQPNLCGVRCNQNKGYLPMLRSQDKSA